MLFNLFIVRPLAFGADRMGDYTTNYTFIIYKSPMDLTLCCVYSVQKVDDHHYAVTGVCHVIGGRPASAQHQHGTAPHLRVPPDEHNRVAGAERQPIFVPVHD